MSNAPNPYFQVGIDVRDRPCLVIGGGEEAANKSGRLLDAGARLTALSPTLVPTMENWARQGRLVHLARSFDEADLAGIFLVINTLSDIHFARLLYQRAQQDRFLLNSFDQPGLSNFGMVALVAPGHLRLGISTSNTSPTLASRLRRDLTNLFDSEFVDYLDQLALVRTHVKANQATYEIRVQLLRSLVEGFHLSGKVDYPADWRDKTQALLACDLAACNTKQACSKCPLSPAENHL